jgi:hypothetical protein
MSLSADGCVMAPGFNPDVRTYECSVNCEVGAHALIGAVRPEIDDYAISLVEDSGSGGNDPYTVLATDPHTLATEVQLDADLAPKHVRIMLGNKFYVGDAVGMDSAVSVYHMTIRCMGQSADVTTSTTPVPGTIRISNRDFEIENICLVILFGSIIVMSFLTIGRDVIRRILKGTLGISDPCAPCTKVLSLCFPSKATPSGAGSAAQTAS